MQMILPSTQRKRSPKQYVIRCIVVLACFGLNTVSASPESKACKSGQVKNLATHGHCCWRGQAWSRDELRCVGLAECPNGLERSNDGEDCLKAKCRGGRIPVSGRCCWPGQKWSAKANRCRGTPKCPTGHVARSGECLPVTYLTPKKTQPYQRVKDSDYIALEPGVYTRGSPRREPGRFRNETAHTAAMTRRTLLKKTEVTQGEWLQLVPHNPSLFVECGQDCPVERVNWYEALEWLNRLSVAEGLTPCYSFSKCTGDLGGGCRVPGEGPRTCVGDFLCQGVSFKGLDCPGYRLPTEAEWEYAARAGTATSTYGGNLTATPAKDAFVLDPIAWYRRNSKVDYAAGQACSNQLTQLTAGPQCGTHPVGRKAPTGWGHVDLLGNVMEWVWDGYGQYPQRSAVNPINQFGLERVIRGGSWATQGRYLRAAVRSRLAPRGRNSELGFRAARTVATKSARPTGSKTSSAKASPKTVTAPQGGKNTDGGVPKTSTSNSGARPSGVPILIERKPSDSVAPSPAPSSKKAKKTDSKKKKKIKSKWRKAVKLKVDPSLSQ